MKHQSIVHSLTVRTFINAGCALLEITKKGDEYAVTICDSGAKTAFKMNLRKEREVFAELTLDHKPTATELNRWMNEKRWFTFNNTAGSVEAMLALLP